MTEECVLVAVPVRLAEVVVPGSAQGNCSECGEPVFIAPSGQKLMSQQPGWKIICVLCFAAREEVTAEEVLDMDPEQEQEFRQTMGYPPSIKTGREILEAVAEWRARQGI